SVVLRKEPPNPNTKSLRRFHRRASNQGNRTPSELFLECRRQNAVTKEQSSLEVAMNSSEPACQWEQEELGEANIIRILVPKLYEPKQLEAIHEAMGRLAEVKNSRLILDMSAVEFLSSACIGWFLKLRQQLRERGRNFQPPCRRRGLFAFFAD